MNEQDKETEIAELEAEIKEMEDVIKQKLGELEQKKRSFQPQKIKMCKYREGDYCTHFKEPTSDSDCSDCISAYDIWRKK